VREEMEKGQLSLFGSRFAGLMLATSLMREVGEIPDITSKDVSKSRRKYKEAVEALDPFKRILDVYTSRWFGNEPLTSGRGKKKIEHDPARQFLQSREAEAWLKDPDDTKLSDWARDIASTAVKASAEKRFFHWELEFPEVFYGPRPGTTQAIERLEGVGFDAIVGNPPYLKEANNKKFFKDLLNPLTKEYYIGKMDIWYAFSCVSIDLLTDGGNHSFIATNNWITSDGAKLLRKKIMSESKIKRYIDFSNYKIFEDASIQTMIYVICKVKPEPTYFTIHFKLPPDFDNVSELRKILHGYEDIKLSDWQNVKVRADKGDQPFTFSSDFVDIVLEKLEEVGQGRFSNDEIGNGIDVLQDFVSKKHLEILNTEDIKEGDGVFVLTDNEKERVIQSDEDRKKIKPYYTTKEIGRYFANFKNIFWIIYADKKVRNNISKYPGIKKHLDKFAPILTSAFRPYGLHRPRKENLFKNGLRILSVRKTRKPIFPLVDFNCYVSRAFLIIKPKYWNESEFYLLGLLNSKIIHFWLYHKGKKQGD